MELAHHGIHVNSQYPNYMIRTRIQTKQPELVRYIEKETFFGGIGCLERAGRSYFVLVQKG